jgi:hypothetical protein
VFDAFKAKEFANRAFNRANISLLDSLCLLKKYPFSGQYLHDEFGVGTFANWIVMPFYGPAGELAGLKKRELGTKPRAQGGKGQFDELFYNHWRLTNDAEKTIVLCEGESDTWVTHYGVGENYTVLGIPTGAGDTKRKSAPPQAPLLAGRKVILAFDGDDAGRAAKEAWFDALTEFGCEVLFAPVPEGQDMASVENPAAIIEAASKIQLLAPSGIRSTPSGYVRPAQKEDKPDSPISNWFFDPTRELVGEGGRAYEGTIEPGGIDATLSSFTLGKKSELINWVTTHGRAWYGSDRDAQLLLGLLQSEGPFLAQGHMATVAGWNDGHFVWPGHSIGPDYWRYVPPTSDIHLASQMWIDPGPWAPEQILTLRKLHAQEVMDPLLAWLAACPIRPLLREFPSLGVVGSSGTGKTTLMETVVPAFTATDITLNLTDTTPHVITAMMGGTSMAPVRFDERRFGARKSALFSIDQNIRDAYTGQASAKGGGASGGHWASVTFYRPLAPLIVSGEDSFSETSHTDRMIMIGLPPKGKNPDILRQVRAWGNTGFAYAYLEWLQQGITSGRLDITNHHSGNPDRQVINQAVLNLGWLLLSDFLSDYGVDLPDPDFSLPLREAKEARKHAPIEDALRWASDEQDCGDFIFSANINDTEYLCLRVENFVHFINKQGLFTLPGGVTAVKRHLADNYEATEEVIEHWGVKKRVLMIIRRRLNWDE